MIITQVPLLSYISLPFQFWKGSLAYKIQVVSTSFQTGKIFFAFNFDQFSVPSGTTVHQITSQYGQAFEINQGSNEFEFAVPFVSPTTELNVPNNNVPSRVDTLGQLNVVVLNPLVAPNNTPTTIHFNVYLAGGDDYELSTLTQSNNVLPSMPQQLSFSARPQSMSAAPLITPMNEVNLAAAPLVAPNDDVSIREDSTQMSPVSVKNLLKKYQMLSTRKFTFPTLDEQGHIEIIPISSFFGGQYIQNAQFSPQGFSNGLFTHFQLLYRQFRGPLRFKVMVDGLTSNYGFSIFFQPPVMTNTTHTDVEIRDAFCNSLYTYPPTNPAALNQRSYYTRSYMATRLPVTHVNGVQKTAEFEIPFSTRYSSLLSWMGYPSENELAVSPLIDMGSLVFYFPNVNIYPSPTTCTAFFYLSLGDESRFGNVFNVPSISTNCSVHADGQYHQSTWPDYYPPGQPSTNTLVRL
jgi:hypothetical protein